MKSYKQTFAVVLGDMDMLRPLGLAGIPCAVVADRGDLPRYSRYATKVLEWSDPWNEPEKLLKTLIAFASTQETKPVLFYESDADLLLVSRNREVLGDYFRFVVPDAILVEDLVDKARFQKLAERLSLPVPKTKLLSADFTNDGAIAWEFPVIVKPLTRKSLDWKPIAGMSKAVRIENEEELMDFSGKFLSHDSEFLIQELIAGAETEIESYHVYVDEFGKIAGEFTGKKIRTYPEEFGQSCALAISDSYDVRELGRDLTMKIRLRGLAKFDFKRSPDGKLFLLEVNPRFSLWHHLAAVAGLNLPEIVYCDLVGLARPALTNVKPGANWCRVWQDIFAAREAKIPLLTWARWAWKCESKPVFSLDDPYPVFAASMSRVWKKIRFKSSRRKRIELRPSQSGLA